MSNIRSTSLRLTYDGTDISQDLTGRVKSFTYNDAMSGEADDISLTLQNIEELWENEWFPDKGAKLTAAIVLTNWEAQEIVIDCGIFELDKIKVKEPPHEVTLEAVSISDASSLRGEQKSHSWEKTTLKAVANELATKAGMTLYYDTTEAIKYDRCEQTDQSDLEFLMKLCKDAGLALKVADNQVVLFDEIKFERAEIVATLIKRALPTNLTAEEFTKMGTIIQYPLNADFDSGLKDIYRGCHIKHKSTKKKQYIDYTFCDPNKATGKILQVNQGVETLAEAERLAKTKLREKNKDEVTGTIRLSGTVGLYAGATINVTGYGHFNGKYIITKASHKVGAGYELEIDIRRCLVGY